MKHYADCVFFIKDSHRKRGWKDRFKNAKFLEEFSPSPMSMILNPWVIISWGMHIRYLV